MAGKALQVAVCALDETFRADQFHQTVADMKLYIEYLFQGATA